MRFVNLCLFLFLMSLLSGLVVPVLAQAPEAETFQPTNLRIEVVVGRETYACGLVLHTRQTGGRTNQWLTVEEGCILNAEGTASIQQTQGHQPADVHIRLDPGGDSYWQRDLNNENTIVLWGRRNANRIWVDDAVESRFKAGLTTIHIQGDPNQTTTQHRLNIPTWVRAEGAYLDGVLGEIVSLPLWLELETLWPPSTQQQEPTQELPGEDNEEQEEHDHNAPAGDGGVNENEDIIDDEWGDDDDDWGMFEGEEDDGAEG